MGDHAGSRDEGSDGDSGSGVHFLEDGSEPSPDPQPTFHWENLGALRSWLFAVSLGLLLVVAADRLGTNGEVRLAAVFLAGFALGMFAGICRSRRSCPLCLGRVRSRMTSCSRCGHVLGG